MKKLHELTYTDMETPRFRRARRFASTVMHIMEDFLPRDRIIRRTIDEHLTEIAWESNAEIINVPDAYDALDKLALERAMLEAKASGTKFP